MTDNNPSKSNNIKLNSNWKQAGKFGYWMALLMSLVTIVSFGLAIMAIPKAGPSCPGPCVEYPYSDIAQFYPFDYIWMIPAIIMMLLYLIVMTIVHHYSMDQKKLFGRIGQNFALISAAILVMDYFVQFSVIQPSVIRGEMDGISLLTQYNSHGLFIALEDLGYLMMSAGFLFTAMVFNGPSRTERVLRAMFIVNFLAVISLFIILTSIMGNDLEYTYELVIISLNWPTLVISGFLIASLTSSKR